MVIVIAIGLVVEQAARIDGKRSADVRDALSAAKPSVFTTPMSGIAFAQPNLRFSHRLAPAPNAHGKYPPPRAAAIARVTVVRSIF
jgi:hypothetical protein